MTGLRDDSRELREAVIATARAMNERGINVNKSGNVSVRCARGTRAGFLLTPTGVPYDRLEPDDVAFVDNDGRATGRCEPSSEWRFHAAIHAARPELHAVVHTHSAHATALACQGLGIPAFHYMVAVAGGPDIRCSEYATFGTQELADLALAALRDRKACLLAHHGVIACGASLDAALALAVEVENLARTYVVVRTLGEPRLLDRAEMDRVLERFGTYGQARPT
jgi:L-fuculose-phosphate aldolase